jgi:hypothetical protein
MPHATRLGGSVVFGMKEFKGIPESDAHVLA